MPDKAITTTMATGTVEPDPVAMLRDRLNRLVEAANDDALAVIGMAIATDYVDLLETGADHELLQEVTNLARFVTMRATGRF